MTTTTTTPLPTVHLYTHSEATSHSYSGDDESLLQMYRDFLTKNHGPVEETDLATKPGTSMVTGLERKKNK